ncbi:MAG: SPOR domain-containing protein [Betaproteobacteria bacterium]|nr:SPOR domain-containing protein [Betaproteobacteria bacterium]
MSRDYKSRSGNGSGGGGRAGTLLLGIFIGLILGLVIALGVAWYVNRMPNPFVPAGKPADNGGARLEPQKPAAQSEDRQAKADKPRFDFYKILPGKEEPATEQEVKQAAQKPSAAKETFFLQAGAFQSASDADNLKAKLALIGMEASIQTAAIPDRGVWHRVRLGPYSRMDELDRARNVLKQNGIDATLIKVRE